jgi:peptidoglycan/xylan/chitin deacetylase (PgdA/CDA1 family)
VRVALSFDDGPGPITSALLDVLAAARWPATFFVLGRNIDEAPWGSTPELARALVVRALREGHAVGNHTYSHLRPEAWHQLPAELARTDAIIRACRSAAGVAAAPPIAVRLPYGVRLLERTVSVPTGTLNAVTIDPRLAVLASLGRSHLHWTTDADDWTLGPDDGAALATRLVAHGEAQAALGLDCVIDLHDSGSGSATSTSGYARPATLDGVRRFVAIARQRGWTPFIVA